MTPNSLPYDQKVKRRLDRRQPEKQRIMVNKQRYGRNVNDVMTYLSNDITTQPTTSKYSYYKRYKQHCLSGE